MDRTIMGIFLAGAVLAVLFMVFRRSGPRTAKTSTRPVAGASAPSARGATEGNAPSDTPSRPARAAGAGISSALSAEGTLEVEDSSSDGVNAFEVGGDTPDAKTPSGRPWFDDAEKETGNASNPSLLEDQGLAAANFRTPLEEEERTKYSRSIFQPLEVTLFDQDARDDLSLEKGGSDRSFNLFSVDKKNDLTRPFFGDDDKES